MQIDNLLQGYSRTIQWGISHGATYKEVKQGNELLHKFCESLIDGSSYSTSEKSSMKQRFYLLKETLNQEIECTFAR